MKEKLIEFYLKWIASTLTKREFAEENNLRLREVDELIQIGKRMYEDSKGIKR